MLMAPQLDKGLGSEIIRCDKRAVYEYITTLISDSYGFQFIDTGLSIVGN